MQRVPGKTTVVRRLLGACVLASWAALSMTGARVDDSIASSAVPAPGAASAALPTVATLAAADDVQVRHLLVPGETLAGALVGEGVSATEAQAWERAASVAFDLAAMQPRHAVVLTLTRGERRLSACEYEIDKYALLGMRLVHGQIQARLKAMPRLAAVRGVVGRVEASLATSAAAAGVPVRMVSQLADVFGWNVDLRADVRPGDEFRVLYSELRDETGASHPGDILAAEVTSGGRTLTAIRFENDDGESEYYDPDGHALGRRFLRYPLDFVAITSQFTDSRMHPLLKRRAPHLGVDFAAPIGTPVRAVADGIVTFAGRTRGYGNQVGIEHAPPYGSSYAHLRRIARGVRVGAEVRKGQVIGWVGRSGMTTGPHLHFMLFRDGLYVDPLTVQLPGDEQLTGAHRAQFSVLRGELVERLADLGRSLAAPVAAIAPPSAATVAANALGSTLASSLR